MDRSRFFDLSRPDEGPERTAYFVLDSLLRSRIDCGFESNTTRYDEDVNVYLVHLLSSLVSSAGLFAGSGENEPAVCDADVFEKVRESDDPRHKSRVYRLHADHLLVSISLFTQNPYVEIDGRRVWESSTREGIGRGKAYYQYAAAFQERLRSVSPALARVLAVLADDFESYVDVLFHMRGEYFNLHQRLGEADLVALQRPPLEIEPGATDVATDVSALRDAFLDAYWAWHQSPTPTSREALATAVKRLKGADPAFGFDLPEN
jgi:hypothetical protein